MASSSVQSRRPPLAPSAPALMAELAASATFREFAAAFRGAFDLPLELVSDCDHGRWVHRACGDCPLRRIPAPRDRSTALAAECPTELENGPRCAVGSRAGSCGRVVSTVPVRSRGQIIGWLGTGGVFFVTPDLEELLRLLVAPTRAVTAPTRARLRDACAAIPVVPVAQYDAIVRLLAVFAEHLAVLADQLVAISEYAESPSMAGVKEYIRQNMGNDITTDDCARRVHMSKSYFCRTFKRATGLVFTEYLARVRAEAARTHITNSQLRVTEVAFAVGFQSLSQFNRVFKRLTGRCPTVYRRDQSIEPLLPPGRSGRAVRPAAAASRLRSVT